MKNSLKITAIASTILIATALGSAPAQASASTSVRSSVTTSVNTTPVVTADPYASVSYSTTGYPTSYHWEASVPIVSSGYVVPTGQAAPTYNNYQHTPQTTTVDTAASGTGATIASLARGQIGIAQDCTAMVENVLRSIGKNVGDLAPAQFYQYGTVVGSPAPGDLVITSGHVAIYVGNGKVVSGGLNGMNTGEHYLADLPGASFVRVS